MQSLDEHRNRRILVVDDNLAIHSDFRKILVSDGSGQELEDAEAAFFGEGCDINRELNVELDSAHQGQEGLEKVVAAVAENRPYALAFVDMRMPPGWDGLTTIEQLWKADPDLQVVICTAYSDNTWSDIREQLGDTDQLLILKKPFDNVEVCQLALALTEKWHLAQQARLKKRDLERMVDERTEQLREREEALRRKHKLEAIGSLASGIAHEFNNVLQVIRGYTRFAMDELSVDAQPHRDLQYAVEAVDRAAEITRQLLNFSRQQPAKKSHQEVNEIVTMTLRMVRPVFGEQIEVDVDLSDEAGIVYADVDIMSQAL
ncbi:MAG: response regulator, partial [Pirellulaceae bacterium]|nr:response regulator [Pirellulaceae bacterium]